LLSALLLLLGYALPASAQGDPGWVAQVPTPSDDEINAVAHDLYCPVCENVPLDVCPTLACEQWRGTIRAKLAEGWTEEQIHRYFAEQYGMRVLAAPPAQGWTWIAYAVPPALFLAGAVMVGRTLRRPQNPAPAAPSLVSEEDQSRVEAELRRRAS
jgi:cytochrome c-type biogenesis protein CcmH